MQQRQLRLGDTLDDYCPRERRVTNHVIVAMVGPDVKQTRCATCDADHEYKHARVPRPRRKNEPAALYSQVLAAVAPKKVAPAPEPEAASGADLADTPPEPPAPAAHSVGVVADRAPLAARPDERAMRNDVGEPEDSDADAAPLKEGPEGPVHRPLIRAQLPRIEGQPPAPRQAPDFTIRQPGGGRPGRFRPRGPRPAGQGFQGGQGGQGGNMFRQGAPRGSGADRQQPQRSPMSSHTARRHGVGGKRSK